MTTGALKKARTRSRPLLACSFLSLQGRCRGGGWRGCEGPESPKDLCLPKGWGQSAHVFTSHGGDRSAGTQPGSMQPTGPAYAATYRTPPDGST